MRSPWILLALVLVVLGLLSGVTGMVLAPIIAGLVLIAFIVWLLMRVMAGKPAAGPD